MSSVPMSRRMTMIGASQSFLRDFRKLQNSETNEAMMRSELMFERVLSRSRRRAVDPVRWAAVSLQAKFVSPEEARDGGDRRQNDEKDDAEHHRTDDFTEPLAEMVPRSVQWRKQRGHDQGQQTEHDSASKPGGAHGQRSMFIVVECAFTKKDGGEKQAETAFGW